MAKRILLIEDEPNIVEALSFILSREGYTVHIHQDGETALRRIRGSVPDMVILDAMLPGRSGFDILVDLRADEGLRHLPVMMLTARGQARDRQMAVDLGVDRFMTKPFANDEVCAQVRALIGA